MSFDRVKVTEWEGTQLELNKVNRYDMAAYLCIASNGVPPTVSKRITLTVECKSNVFFVHCVWGRFKLEWHLCVWVILV